MRKKTGINFTKIVLYLVMRTILIAYQSCKKDRTSVDRLDSLGIAGEDWSPSWSPDGQKIAYYSARDGNVEIYTMNADGSDQIRLTDEPGNDVYASWSPDGRKILFATDRDFDEEVYVMDADGSNPVNITHNAQANEAFGLAPLPRSELNLDEIPYKLAFESFRETKGKENWEICLIDANGSNLINLTTTSEIDEKYPHASPDGRQVCFEAHEGKDEESKSRNVYYMNIDGTGRILVAENAYQPCWGPDGRHIAYLPGEYPRYNPSVWANKGIANYDIKTKEIKRHPNDEIIHIWGLCWSPDGEWFVSAGGKRGRPGGEDAFKVNNKTMMNLTMTGYIPDISADGNSFAWNESDWNLNIGKLDFDSPQSSVTDHRIVVACDHEHWVYHADWSPDGKYLAFTYAPGNAGNRPGRPAPGANICICDLRTGKWTLVTTDGKHNKELDWVPLRVR